MKSILTRLEEERGSSPKDTGGREGGHPDGDDGNDYLSLSLLPPLALATLNVGLENLPETHSKVRTGQE